MELVSSESIDTLDSLCSSIRVDMKGSEIVRILPRRNDIINQDWITDKTRYSFDGLKNQRFSYPMLYTKEDGCFKLSNWNAFFSSFMLNHLGSVGTSFSGNLTLGGGLDLYTIYLSNLLTKSLSSFSLSGNVSSSVSDFRSSYLSFPLSDIQSSSVVFLSGLNLARSFPLINVRVQQKVNSKHPCIVLYNGTSYNFSYDVSHFGLTYESTFSLLRGKHVCSSYLFASKSSVFFSSEHLETFTSFLPSSLNVRTNVLMSNTSLISSSELGLLRSDLGFSSFYYGINVSDCPSLTTVSHCILHSTHSNLSLSLIRSHENLLNVWFLPSFSSFETELPYLNLLGIVQWTRKCSSSFGESSTYEDVLRRLISLSSSDTSNLSFDQFLNRVPSLVGSSLPVISFKLSTVTFEDKNLFSTVETEVPFTRFSFLSTASN